MFEARAAQGLGSRWIGDPIDLSATGSFLLSSHPLVEGHRLLPIFSDSP
jgi:hypothetical protein